ncbi:unnamed protein product, partial [Meganyctiphanes norvegica]
IKVHLQITDIEYAELQKKLDAGEITLIDVRNPGELIRDGRIPYAKNVVLMSLGGTMMLSPEEYEARLGFKKPELDSPIAVMCLAGIRSLTAQCALKGIGYTNIRKYKGSFEDWVNQGGLVEYTKEK